jgi:hypothetical protein
MKRSNDLWQKGDASSANNKDTYPETVQRSLATRTPPLPIPSPHETHPLLLEPEPHKQTMKKQSSPHQNPRKESTMSLTPSDTLTMEKGKS